MASSLPVSRNVLIDRLMADLHDLDGNCLADLIRAVSYPQLNLGLILNDSDRHLRPGSFPALPFLCKALGLRRSITTFAVVARQLLFYYSRSFCCRIGRDESAPLTI